MQLNFTEGYASRLTPAEGAEEPSYYQSHFGVPKSSAAQDTGVDFLDAYHTIKIKIYVDDYLVLAEDVEKAVTIAFKVHWVLAAGDFHLRPRTSNSQALLTVLGAVNEVDASNTRGPQTHILGADEVEKVLGIKWVSERDLLGFTVTAEHQASFTRVGLTSKVATQSEAKIRLRTLGSKGLQWTYPIDQEDETWWSEWCIIPPTTLLRVPTLFIPEGIRNH